MRQSSTGNYNEIIATSIEKSFTVNDNEVIVISIQKYSTVNNNEIIATSIKTSFIERGDFYWDQL